MTSPAHPLASQSGYVIKVRQDGVRVTVTAVAEYLDAIGHGHHGEARYRTGTDLYQTIQEAVSDASKAPIAARPG